MVEIDSGRVVTNDFPWITHDLFFEWRDHHRPDAPDLWPDDVREEMDDVMERVFTEVNNGVYRCGFAGSQEAYDEAYERLWNTLDWLEDRLTDRRYLMGPTITEADVRLFTTLARFDPVYHGHFKCNRQKLSELPALWGYARDLFQTPAFGDNTDFGQIKQHYYVVQTDVNPSQIVPQGPDLSGWRTPHGRERL
jgi:putative glutathione S-transferase